MECSSFVQTICPPTLEGVSCQFFLTLINSLMAAQCSFDVKDSYPPNYGETLRDGEEFDFIIVGAGSAGSVVANRLSEIEDWKILLLESGGYPTSLSEIPGLLFSAQDTELDWKYKTQPSEKYGAQLVNKQSRSPRGKGLGGSSLINAQLYVRGNKNDYDGWEKEGNTGWGYASILKLFQKNEKVQDSDIQGYGRNGNIDLSRYKCHEPIRQVLEDVYQELGYREATNDSPLGYTDALNTISNGLRVSTGKSFLQPIKDRPNLFVALHAVARKLIINKHTKAVEGVEIQLGDKIIKAYSKKEVILSAGSINSPQILMNSGIGPKEHLDTLGIEQIENLPVGENLQDHVIVPISVNIDNSAIAKNTPQNVIDDLYSYFMHRKGKLGQISLTNFIGFVNTRNDSKYPNIQYHYSLHPQNDPYVLSALLNAVGLSDSIKEAQVKYNRYTSNLFLVPTLLKPKSRGKILIDSADAFGDPIIIPGYFEDEQDLEELLEGIKMGIKMVETKAFEVYNPQIVDWELENCRGLPFKSDEYWRCFMRSTATNIYHPVGTCKMGPKSDKTSVVDSRLQVHKIKGVRVIDGSIMPTIVSGNTNAPIIMIGQKGSEMIREDWLNKREEL